MMRFKTRGRFVYRYSVKAYCQRAEASASLLFVCRQQLDSGNYRAMREINISAAATLFSPTGACLLGHDIGFILSIIFAASVVGPAKIYQSVTGDGLTIGNNITWVIPRNRIFCRHTQTWCLIKRLFRISGPLDIIGLLGQCLPHDFRYRFTYLNTKSHSIFFSWESRCYIAHIMRWLSACRVDVAKAIIAKSIFSSRDGDIYIWGSRQQAREYAVR